MRSEFQPVFDRFRLAANGVHEVGFVGLSRSVDLASRAGIQPPGDFVVGHRISSRLGTLVSTSVDHVIGEYLHRLGSSMTVHRVELGESLPDLGRFAVVATRLEQFGEFPGVVLVLGVVDDGIAHRVGGHFGEASFSSCDAEVEQQCRVPGIDLQPILGRPIDSGPVLFQAARLDPRPDLGQSQAGHFRTRTIVAVLLSLDASKRLAIQQVVGHQGRRLTEHFDGVVPVLLDHRLGALFPAIGGDLFLFSVHRVFRASQLSQDLGPQSPIYHTSAQGTRSRRVVASQLESNQNEKRFVIDRPDYCYRESQQ